MANVRFGDGFMCTRAARRLASLALAHHCFDAFVTEGVASTRVI